MPKTDTHEIREQRFKAMTAALAHSLFYCVNDHLDEVDDEPPTQDMVRRMAVTRLKRRLKRVGTPQLSTAEMEHLALDVLRDLHDRLRRRADALYHTQDEIFGLLDPRTAALVKAWLHDVTRPDD